MFTSTFSFTMELILRNFRSQGETLQPEIAVYLKDGSMHTGWVIQDMSCVTCFTLCEEFIFTTQVPQYWFCIILHLLCRRDFFTICKENGLSGLAVKFGLMPDQFGENLRDRYKSHEPEQHPVEPEVAAEEYLCVDG